MDDLLTPDTWTSDDDTFVRSALDSLRADVDANPLCEPQVVRTRGDVARRRRMLSGTAGVAAAVAIVAALGFRGLAHEDTSLPPLPATPTPTLGVTPAPLPSASSSGIDMPSASPGETLVCPAVGWAPADTSDVPPAVAATARALHGEAACDYEKGVVARFERDGTIVSLGGTSVADALAMPEHEERYHTLRGLLATRSSYEDGLARWPALPESDADWNRLSDAGVLTPADAAAMRASGLGYTGPRVVIASDGRVTAYVTGD